VELVEPGDERDAASIWVRRDPTAQSGSGSAVARVGEGREPSASLLPEARGLHWGSAESLLALRWCDVDEEREALSFSRALVQGPRGPTLTWTKTHRPYRVELDRDTFDVLMGHRASVEARAAKAAGGLADDAFVFSLRPDGSTPWKPHWVTKHFISARRAAALPHFRLHDLRHFMSTQMLAAGVSIATDSQRLSHARASTTLNVYAHSVPGGDRQAAETRRHSPSWAARTTLARRWRPRVWGTGSHRSRAEQAPTGGAAGQPGVGVVSRRPAETFNRDWQRLPRFYPWGGSAITRRATRDRQ
jgi:hypothetical protein